MLLSIFVYCFAMLMKQLPILCQIHLSIFVYCFKVWVKVPNIPASSTFNFCLLFRSDTSGLTLLGGVTLSIFVYCFTDYLAGWWCVAVYHLSIFVYCFIYGGYGSISPTSVYFQFLSIVSKVNRAWVLDAIEDFQFLSIVSLCLLLRL